MSPAEYGRSLAAEHTLTDSQVEVAALILITCIEGDAA